MASSRYARNQYGAQANTARNDNVNLINIIAETYRDTSDRLDRNADIFYKIGAQFDNVQLANRQLEQGNRQLAQKDRDFYEGQRQFNLKLKQNYDLARKQLAIEAAKLGIRKQTAANQSDFSEYLKEYNANKDKGGGNFTTNFTFGSGESSYAPGSDVLNLTSNLVNKHMNVNSTPQNETASTATNATAAAAATTQPQTAATGAEIDDGDGAGADVTFLKKRLKNDPRAAL